MPTKKQLHDIWDSELELFGGYGLPRDSNQNLDGGRALTEPRYINEPQSSAARDIDGSKSSIDVVGNLRYNREKQCLELTSNEPQKDG